MVRAIFKDYKIFDCGKLGEGLTKRRSLRFLDFSLHESSRELLFSINVVHGALINES